MTKIRITVDSEDIVNLNRLRGISEDRAQDSLLHVIQAGNEAIAAVPKLGEVITANPTVCMTGGNFGDAICDTNTAADPLADRPALTPLDEAVDNLVERLFAKMKREEPMTPVFQMLSDLHLLAIALKDVRRQRRASTAP